MTTIRIPRKTIIEAILTEPMLYPGRWVGFIQWSPEFDPAAVPVDVRREALNNRNNQVTSAGGYDVSVTNTMHCTVCAVGAVLRRVLAPEQPAYNIYRAATAGIDRRGVLPDITRLTFEEAIEYDATLTLLDDGHYMAALSGVFEAVLPARATPQQVEELRVPLAKWVEERFPEYVEFDIDGAAPAEGVEVIDGGAFR